MQTPPDVCATIIPLAAIWIRCTDVVVVRIGIVYKEMRCGIRIGQTGMWHERFMQSKAVLRLTILMVAATLLLIPVRCDASPDPHSIFVDPIAINGNDMRHAGHPVGEPQANHAHSLHAGASSADSIAALDDALATNPAFRGDFANTASDSAAPSNDAGTTSTDLKSLSDPAGMFDTVFSIHLRAVVQDHRVVVARVLQALPVAHALSGTATAPSTPPPR
jgi:hypothetical protein